jgi:AcrR family transcriptional regulator
VHVAQTAEKTGTFYSTPKGYFVKIYQKNRSEFACFQNIIDNSGTFSVPLICKILLGGLPLVQAQISDSCLWWLEDNVDDPYLKRLLSSSLELFASRGYNAVSVEDIVARSRTSKRTFYRYFGGKDEALKRCFELAVEKLYREGRKVFNTPNVTLFKKLRMAVAFYLRTLCVEHADIARLLLVEAVGVSPEFEQIRLRAHNRFIRQLQKELDKAIENEEIEPQNTFLLASMFFGSLNEVITQMTIYRMDEPLSVSDAIRYIVPSLFRMIR